MKTNNPIKQFFLMTLVHCLLFAPLAIMGQNLVSNSGFSSGSTSWATNCSIEVNPETAYGGTNGSNYTTEIDVERCFNQDICILPGLTYSFSFKASRRTQAATVAAPGMRLTITGLSTAIQYINFTKTYSNTVFNLQTETYSFTVPAGATDKKVKIAFTNYNNTGTYGVVLDDITVPAGATDKKVKIAFTNYNNTGTYGVILDDIQLAPAAGSTLSVNGADILSPGLASNWAVNNATASITSYTWNFGANANQSISSLTAPTGIMWSSTGAGNVSVALSNGTCTVATISKNVFIINGLLAVQFTSFTGSAKNNYNQLNWSTGNEENNKYFIVERSFNGVAFDSIGLVLPASNGALHNYSFTDASFNTGNNYYRLRQTDMNGAWKNSATIVIKNNTTQKVPVQLFPNPAVSSIHLQLNSNTTTIASVQVLNASGAILINKKQSLPAGNNLYTIDINSLDAGMYFIKITSETGSIQFVQPFCKFK